MTIINSVNPGSVKSSDGGIAGVPIAGHYRVLICTSPNHFKITCILPKKKIFQDEGVG